MMGSTNNLNKTVYLGGNCAYEGCVIKYIDM